MEADTFRNHGSVIAHIAIDVLVSRTGIFWTFLSDHHRAARRETEQGALEELAV